MKILKLFLPYIIGIAIGIFLCYQCERPKETTKTIIDYEKIVDSLQSLVIIPEPIIDTIYLDSLVYLKSDPIILKGKETIVYKTDTIKLPVETNRYDTKLKSNNAIADLSIYTSGTLYKVDGTISYNKEIKTVETTKTIYENATYLYLETSLMPFAKKLQVGVDRTINNKIIFGASVEYVPYEKLGYINGKIGFNISKN